MSQMQIGNRWIEAGFNAQRFFLLDRVLQPCFKIVAVDDFGGAAAKLRQLHLKFLFHEPECSKVGPENKDQQHKMKNTLLDKAMQRVFELARLGDGKVSPNPMVGAVLLKGNRIVAEEYHRKLGAPHAEIDMLKQAGARAKGGHLVINLEPCAHQGRTPPCADAVIAAGIRQVTIAMRDPNPLVNGKGIVRLRRAGIRVTVGTLEAEARLLNERFIKYITTRLPWVTLKAAVTLDGRIAAAEGEARTITGKPSQQAVHRLRAGHDAILVGIGTVLADDPQLNVRFGAKAKQPLKIVLDGALRTPPSAKVMSGGNILLVAAESAPPERKALLERLGAEIMLLPQVSGRMALRPLLQRLAEREIGSLLVEGGSAVHSSFLREKLADKLNLFVAPKLLGGGTTEQPNLNWLEELGITRLEGAFTLTPLSAICIGADLLIETYPQY